MNDTNKRHQILFVDSDSSASQSFEQLAAEAGYDTIPVTAGQDALATAREVLPSLIVVCVELADMNGFSVLIKFRKDPMLNTVPIIITSAEATEETFTRHRQLRQRADAYLLKPYRNEQLLEQVDSLTSEPRSDIVANLESRKSLPARESFSVGKFLFSILIIGAVAWAAYYWFGG